MDSNIPPQQNTDLPPQVLAVSPYPGEEMPPNTPLTITFNQAMNSESVQEGLQFDPAISGTFDWVATDTLVFTPAENWERGGRYTLTIDQSVTAENGLELGDPYKANLRIAGHLRVDSVIPAANAEGVAADATITLAFNRPVVPLGSTEDLAALPNPIQIEPAISGTGEWLNTSIYQFRPDDALLGGTRYTVTVPAGLTDVTGAVLEEAYTWTFETLVPEILGTTPYEGSDGVQLDSQINIVFSQPMDTATTESAFSLTHAGTQSPIEGEFEWNADSTILTFTPASRLEIASSYRLMLDETLATGISGAALRNGRDFTFKTIPLPFISNVYPENGTRDIRPGPSNIRIQFGSPMNTETFAGKYTISPEPETITPMVYGDRDLNLNFAFQPNTSYTVTLLAGMEDIYGNAIPNDYTFTFHVGTAPDHVSLTDQNRFFITGAYRPNTSLSVNVVGTPTVEFSLYELSITQLHKALYYMREDDLNTLINTSTLIRTWSETLGNKDTYGTLAVNLQENGGPLPQGTYFVVARWDRGNMLESFFGTNQIITMNASLGVVSSNVTIKRAEGESLIWVTDMQTSAPLAEQNIRIYREGSLIAESTTDAEGIARIPLTVDNQVMVIAESESHYGLWHSHSINTASTENLYLYTDRPIYRPGETLYVRGIYRENDDFTYTIGDLEQIQVNIYDNRGQVLFDDAVSLNDFGSFSLDLALPEDVAVGWLNIEAMNNHNYLGSISAQVAEFRVPEYRVTVTPSQSEIIAGESLTAIINGSYFSGGAVSTANINWTANATKTFFNYTGAGRYTFTHNNTLSVNRPIHYGWDFDSIGSSRQADSGSGLTDSAGNLLVDISNTTPEGPYPEQVVIEGVLNDESGQYIAGRSNVIIHPAEVYVGLTTNRYFTREGQAFPVEGITVTPQSDPVPNQLVTLTLIERRWEREEIPGQFGRYDWAEKEIEVESIQLTTGEDGRLSHEFTAPNAGNFIVVARTYDRLERFHESSIRLWVTGGSRSVWWGRPSNNIDLIADAESYQAGDTAQILVPISLEGTSHVLMSIERAGVMHYEIIQVEGSTLLYEVPITQEHEPGIFVSAVVVHGIDEANPVPTFRQGRIQLNVEPVSKRLNVTITPSTTAAQPGEEVTLDIQVTDVNGAPVAAEIGLALVDQAILTLASPNSTDPETNYYGNVYSYTQTEVMLAALIDGRLDEEFTLAEEQNVAAAGLMMDRALSAPAPMAAFESVAEMEMDSGSGAAFDQVTVRQDFQQTPLWEAHLVTNSDGYAQISVTMPDNLTIWDLTARSLTADTQVAETKLEIASTLPLLVRPATPRFFTVGDEVTLAAIINNNSDETQHVSATLRGEGYELLQPDALEQTIDIPAGDRARLVWPVHILDVSAVDLTFIAVGNDGYQDASKPPLATGPNGTIPVYRYTAPDTTGTGGVLRDVSVITEAISLPPTVDSDQGTLTLQLDPSLAVTTIDALDYLRNFEHQCIEQTVSRFLPNVMTLRALQQLGVEDDQLASDLRATLTFALEKLKTSQNSDGGWGWFAGMQSNGMVTAYALLGLIETQQADYAIDQHMIDRAMAFLRTQSINPTEDTLAWQLNRQAFYFYVLARDSRNAPSVAELDRLFDVRLEMSHYAKAYLLMAYNSLTGDHTRQTDALTSDLISAAHLSATGAHWEEAFRDWWNWGSDTRSTAIVLSALIESDPDNALLPNAVRWLMVARRGDRWESTQETAWAVMALTDWMVSTNELQGDYEYNVLLNGESVSNREVTPETVREGEKLVFEVGSLLLDEMNRVTIDRGEGEGALYYTAHLQLQLDANEVSALDRGVSVTREYFNAAGDKIEDGQAQMGDVVTVRLTVTVPETLYYFNLQDFLPAGLEALDTSLLTTSRETNIPQLTPQHPPSYYWRWWVWSHTEIRDESVNLYADVLPEGTYVYSYQAQATTPGIFQTRPAHGYAFYFPEVFGRSDGQLFTVTE